MKRIDLRIYINDEMRLGVPLEDLHKIGQLAARVVEESISLCCEPECPEGFVKVLYDIDENADPNDMGL